MGHWPDALPLVSIISLVAIGIGIAKLLEIRRGRSDVRDIKETLTRIDRKLGGE